MSERHTERSPLETTSTLLAPFDLTSQLRSNHCPSPSDVAALLVEVEKILATRDAEIAKLQATLFSIQRERDSIFRQMSSLRSILAPIRRLPSDVLVEIFKYHQAKNADGFITFEGRRVLIPMLEIANVCSYWRSLILANTCFWTNVRIYALEAKTSGARLQTILDRSRNSLLCIHLNLLHWDGAYPDGSIDILIQKSSRRWKSLTIIMIDDTFIQCFASLHGKLNTLQRLCIHTIGYRQGTNCDIKDVDAFEIAPHLRDVKLQGAQATRIRVPLPELRRLDLENFTTDEVSKAMLHCPNLQYLRIANPYAESTSAIQLSSHQLTEIDLNDVLPDYALMILSLCHVLQVARIAVKNTPVDARSPRVTSNITHLSFRCHQEHRVEVDEMFTKLALPSLECLTLFADPHRNGAIPNPLPKSSYFFPLAVS